MTTGNGGPSMWRDFAHSLRVVVASATAASALDGAALAARPVQRQFNIALLAAAGAHGIILPDEEFTVEGGELAILIEQHPVAAEITVRLQLKGFAALQTSAGREARLVSDNRAIDYDFRFSGRGTATCILQDSSDVRAGLLSFQVLSFADELGPAASP